MLAGQLLSIAEDLSEDYDNFEILGLIQDAISLSQHRPQLQESEYRRSAAELTTRAQYILSNSITSTYPIEEKRLLNKGGFSQSLPENIARIIIAGFQGRKKEGATSSGELQMYFEEANAFYNSMNNLVRSAKSFGIESYHPPEGMTTLNVRIPDFVYGRNLGDLPSRIKRIDGFVSIIEELLTGSRSPHEILSAATSDLIITISLGWGTVAGILVAYERLLAVAEKHLTVMKLLKDLRQAGGAEMESVEATIKQTIQKELASAVKQIIENVNRVPDSARANELETELKSLATDLVKDISAGLRFSADPRYERKVIMESDAEDASTEAAENLKARHDLEQKLDVQVSSFGHEDMLLLFAPERIVG